MAARAWATLSSERADSRSSHRRAYVAPDKTLQPRASFRGFQILSRSKRLTNLAHELMHSAERRSSTSKRIRETEAEAVAFVVCSAIGLDTGTTAQDYIGLYGSDTKLLVESLQYVQQASSQILNAIGADGGSAPPA
jgi:hypothetical protein